MGSERFRAPELLFNPELIGQEYAGVHQVIVDSITRVDMDLRKSLYSNIVLSGGSTLCKGASGRPMYSRSIKCPLLTASSVEGFGDRLLNETKKLAIKELKIKIFAPPERKYSTWIGGSILAGLSTFKKVKMTRMCPMNEPFLTSCFLQMWVSAEEYQEDPEIIHKKTGF